MAVSQQKKNIVAIWLLVGVFMIMVQVIIGGITRLTGSGLSMTEWNPIMGFIPPLNHEDWMKAFESYQEIAQFKYMNNHFTLSDFKFIFFWEWFHRVWARSLGVVFAIPFIYFILKKYFSKDMIWPLGLLFILGGLQGFIGWYMVQSGLYGSELLHVSHIRLAIHFVAALVLLIYTFWFALKLLIPKDKLVVDSGLRNLLWLTIALLVIQLFYGAFMAGMHAARFAPSWPTINGFWIPKGLADNSWINSPINVQFVHRGIAYLLLILITWSYFKFSHLAKKSHSSLLAKASKWPLVLVWTQVLLGIFALLTVSRIEPGKFGLYETLAQVHQLVAMLLLMALVLMLYLVRKKA